MCTIEKSLWHHRLKVKKHRRDFEVIAKSTFFLDKTKLFKALSKGQKKMFYKPGIKTFLFIAEPAKDNKDCATNEMFNAFSRFSILCTMHAFIDKGQRERKRKSLHKLLKLIMQSNKR